MKSKVWDKQHGVSHYQKYKIQPSKFVVENELLYPEGCAIKYIIRHQDKNGNHNICKTCYKEITGKESRIEHMWSDYIDKYFGTNFLFCS